MEYLEYPKMLYHADGGYCVVADAVAEGDARAAGWGAPPGAAEPDADIEGLLGGTPAPAETKPKVQRRPAGARDAVQ